MVRVCKTYPKSEYKIALEQINQSNKGMSNILQLYPLEVLKTKTLEYKKLFKRPNHNLSCDEMKNIRLISNKYRQNNRHLTKKTLKAKNNNLSPINISISTFFPNFVTPKII